LAAPVFAGAELELSAGWVAFGAAAGLAAAESEELLDEELG